jgi:hypothetical protein
MSFFLLTIYFFTIFFGIATRRGKFGFYLCFLVAWLLIAGNYENADYWQYVMRYDDGLVIQVEIGYSLLCEIFRNLGCNYLEFKAIVTFISLFFIFKTIYRLSVSPSVGAALFLIYPFIIDITQIRNFIAYGIVFAAIPYLFNNDWKSIVKYCAIVFLASTIHVSAIFYLLFILAKVRIKFFYVVVGIVILEVAKEALKLFFANQMGTEKLDFLEKPSVIGAIFGSIIVYLNYLLIYFVYNKKRFVKSQSKFLWARFSTEKIWLYCNMMFLAIIPFLFDNGNYSRVYRNMAILNMIFILNAYYVKKKIKLFLMITYYAYFIITGYFARDYFQEVLHPVFTFNYFAL